MKIALSTILVSASIALATSTASATNITGAGATFPQPVYAKWAEDYKAQTGNEVNYQGIGSSGGIKQIDAGTVDFGASDAALKPEELEKKGLIQFPTVIGAVVPVVNIAGIKGGQLTLSGEVLAEIYLGKITKWNDAKIVALNKGVNLPDANIATVFRSDGSGTSYNFTYYLSQVSADWKNGPGANKSPKWPTAGASGLGGKGNDGVAAFVTKTQNAIGYVEYAYAKENHLAYTKLINKAGQAVEPSLEAFQAAGNADWKAAPGFNLTIANQSDDPKAWPIAASTFILVHTNPKNPDATKAALAFFDWAYKNGDKAAEALSYVPFSQTNKDLFKASWNAVKGSDGKALY